MVREIVHLLRHLPATLRLKRELPHAELYHLLMQRGERAGLSERRAELCGDLRGEVLEVGSGTGLMFPHYAPGTRVLAVEPDDAFRALSLPAARAAAADIDVVKGDATDLPFADARFDAVVVGLVLCSVASIEAVLGELARVLRPGGSLRLIEHVRSHGAIAGPLMTAFDPLWLRLNQQGCHMDRRPQEHLAAAGFAIDELRAFQVFTPGIPAFPMLQIRAIKH